MSREIRASVEHRGITRLCHFTPSRNLVHIVTDPRGMLAVARLTADEQAVVNPTDLARLDGHRGHICCSIQYPNAWYFERARSRDRLFKDWVVLLIDPRYLWLDGTKFCPRNAAAAGGREIRAGEDAFESLFAPSVPGKNGRLFNRQMFRPGFLPTDEQAEVLVPDRIARRDVLGIVVVDESQAKREIVRLETLGETVPPITIAPDFFDPHRQNQLFQLGRLPEERLYHPGDGDD